MRTSHIWISTKRRVGTMFGQQYLFYDLGECAIKSLKISKNRQHNGQNKKDKQRSTKNTCKTKDRVTQTH
jgi:hypothetical protein